MIKAVIFDVDGTLIDSVDLHARAWQDILARHGHDIPLQDVHDQIGKGGDQLLPVFLSEEEVEEKGEAISEERSEYFQREYLPKVRPLAMSRELVERVRADGKTVAIATSGKADEVEKYLKIARIDDLVHEQSTADDAERSKPHPDIFASVLAKLDGISASEAIAIGDTPYDAQAAGKVGLRTIGVLSGGFSEAELRAAGCIAIYRDPADLLAHYDDSPLAG